MSGSAAIRNSNAKGSRNTAKWRPFGPDPDEPETDGQKKGDVQGAGAQAKGPAKSKDQSKDQVRTPSLTLLPQ